MKSFALLIVCLLVLGCTKKKVAIDQNATLGLGYYPLTIGKFVTYQVDSTVYTEIPKDTINYSYQLKEIIADKFTEADGSVTHRLERYVRTKTNANTFGNWRILDVWAIRASNSAIEIQESNTRYTRLVFPVSRNVIWNGNAANTLGAQDFSYDYVNQAENIDTSALKAVAKVTELDNVNLIEAHQSFKKYAKGAGLVYAEYNNLKGNTIVAGKTVFDRIESGLRYKQVLISYGIE